MATPALVVLLNPSSIDRQFSFVMEHDTPVITNARELQKPVVDMETFG
ncbi:MAG: hypothetical protein GY758_27335 [Fuerstiella sp.]|nr:hypothetical protein [Fuerstiella sp.]